MGSEWERKYQKGVDPEFRIDYPWQQASGMTSTIDNIVQHNDGITLKMPSHQLEHNAVLFSNFKFKYGTIRALIKVPNVPKAWSAFWIFRGMPEMDIFEHCGGRTNEVNVTHHWGCDYGSGGKKSTLHNERYNKDFKPRDEYYLYEVTVTPYEVVYKINGVVTKTMTTGIPSHDGHIIFNVTAEGSYCGTVPTSGLTDDATMEIKWLEVYETCN